MKKSLKIVFLIFAININAQIDIVHPPNWWIGFENQNLQLLVKGEKINTYEFDIKYPGVKIKQIHKADSPNYLFIDLFISKTKPGIFKLKFAKGNSLLTYDYRLDFKRTFSNQSQGFDSSDVIYLITPDRYANGDYSNDIITIYKKIELTEKMIMPDMAEISEDFKKY